MPVLLVALSPVVMAQSPTKEGTVPFNIPSLDTPCFTYFKVVGDLSSGSPPVVVLHGGPGAGHEYLLSFAEFWPRYGLPVVFYDQIGCASSTHLPQTAGDHSFWQESLFIAELDNLLDLLQLRDGPGFHLLGQSWGGRLAAAYAARRPQGLRRLVLASGLASTELATRGRRLQMEQLPPDARQALDEAERTGDLQNPAYLDALAIFNKKYMCRADPFPPEELKPAMKNLAEDKTVHKTMSVVFPPFPTSLFASITHVFSLLLGTAPHLCRLLARCKAGAASRASRILPPLPSSTTVNTILRTM